MSNGLSEEELIRNTFKVNDMNYTTSVINCADWMFVLAGSSVIVSNNLVNSSC